MDSTKHPQSRSANHWENYWSGGDQSNAYDAAVTGAARSEAFQAAWRAFFDDISLQQKGAAVRLMDLACGGGVVTEIAMSAMASEQLARLSLVGVDYSPTAARRYAAKFKSSGAASAIGIVGDALLLPFDSGAADVAVSQFGLEYAGAAAVAGASRLLAPSGKIMCLTHYRSGAIERECSENLRIADEIISSEVLAKARLLFADPVAPQAMQQLTSGLQTLRSLAEESAASAGNRLLTRLRTDLMRLTARRAAFDPGEAIGWLNANAAEISMYRDRMRSMTGAALDEAQIDDVMERWRADGLEVEEPAAITMDGAPAPSAWRLSARRL